MELLDVSENDEECVALHLEEQLGDCRIQEIHYVAEKHSLVVLFFDDYVVDDLLTKSPSFLIEGRSYRAQRLYSAELLDIRNAELALLYIGTYIGNVVYERHYPDEHRLVVGFDAAEAIEKLYKQEGYVVEEGIAFRVKHVSKPQVKLTVPASPMQEQHLMHHQQKSQEQGSSKNWQQEFTRRQHFMQRKRQQLQQHQQDHQQNKLLQLQKQQQQQQHAPQAHAEDTDFHAEHSVVMSGIPETVSKIALELQLTKQWKQLGVNYRHVDYNPSTGMAVVSFSAAQDVQQVLQDGKHEGIQWSIRAYDDSQTVPDLLGNIVLLIDNISSEFSTEALWCWTKVAVGDFAHTMVYSTGYNMAAAVFDYFTDLNLDGVANHAKTHVVDNRRLHVTSIRHTKKAKALGLPENASSTLLKKHLEDAQNGGRQGNVACIEMADQCTAVVTFCNEYVLTHAMSQRHVLLGQEISLVPLFDDVGPVTSCRQVFKFGDMKRALIEADAVPAIPIELIITGFDSQIIDESALRQFLSQRHMSGGGEIRSYSCSKDKAVITFMDSECATRIYQKYQCEGLQLCGCRLSASLRSFDISNDTHKNQILLQNIGVASDDSLKYWLWGILDNQVHRIDFVRKNEDPQLCAIAHLERDVDFRRLSCSLKTITLDGLLLESDSVSRPRSVLATNIPDGTHPDLVILCFSNFGSVQEVRKIVPQQWVVTFCQSKDAARACQETITFRAAVKLETCLYIDFKVQPDARQTGQRGRLLLPLNFVDRAVVTFALARRQTALNDMLQPFRSIVSTNEKDGTASVVCSLSQSDPCYRDILQLWPTLQEACVTFFAPFRSKSILVSTCVFEAVTVSERFLLISCQCDHNLLVISRLGQNGASQEIVLAGTLQATEEAFAAVQSIVKDISDSMERSKQRVPHVTDRMADSAMKLLESIGFFRNARTCYNELNIDFDWENRVIHFEGTPEDIAAVNEDMRRVLNGSSEEAIKVSTAMLVLLERGEIREFVDEQLKQNKLADRVIWSSKPFIGVCVRGLDATSTHEAATIIRTQFVDLPIALDVSSTQLLKTEKWETFCRDIIQRYRKNLVLSKLDSDQSGATLRLSCKVADSERVIEEVQGFLRRHTIREDFISLPCITLEFLTKFMHDNIILQIEKLQSRNFVKFQQVGDLASKSVKMGFQIVGNLDGIINAKRLLVHLMKTHKVSTRRHTVSSPGAEQHFKSQEAVLVRIGNETKTIICISSGSDDEVELQLDESGLLTASQVIMPCGTELHVLRGDISQLSCDAIVNPANGQLQHRGGLARVIAESGGQAIVDESTAFVREHGQLSDGQVCVTAAGALPCKKVIHAVGPQWQGGDRNEENKLFNAVQNSLAAVVRNGLTSVAIPPISSGVFGYPLEKSTRTIVESVMDYCKNSSKPPQKIILIDNKNGGVRYFKEAVDQLVSRTNSTTVQAAASGSASRTADAPRQSSAAQEPNLLERILSFVRSKITAVQAPQPTAQQPLAIGQALVELIEGSLVDQKVDVLVNTVGPRLQLDQGALSKSISVAAGPALQITLHQNYPNGLTAGDVGISDGFQLPCRYVFHCCCSFWNSGNAEQVLSNLISKCLKEASARGMLSIAIPAIGTGQLGFPPHESARIIYEAVLQFYRTHSSSSVRFVKLVVQGQPQVTAAFQAQHCAIHRNGGGAAAQVNLLRSTNLARGRGTTSTGSIRPQGVSGAPAFSLDLKICGSEDGIGMAIKAVDQYCQKTAVEFVERDPEDGCRMLSSGQVDDLVQQSMEDGVALDFRSLRGSVVIRSLDRSAAKAVQLLVRSTLTGQQVQRLQQETVAHRCQWQFMDVTGQWHDYEASLNAKLEHAHRTGLKSVSYKSADDSKYVVNFKDMKDFAEGNPTNSAKVQRIDKEQGILSGLISNDKYSEEHITKGSPEYTKVETAFFKTAPTSLRIVEIRRIRNPYLLKQYEVQAVKVKENMQRNTTLSVERCLWHGTDEISLQKICKHGFNRSYCGVNGVYHGHGVYFARDASYSALDQYSKPNAAGLKHMIYTRVLTGEFVLGDPQMKTPPPRQYGNQANYDSSVNNVKNPSVFVVYHDAQAYPEFVVRFR